MWRRSIGCYVCNGQGGRGCVGENEWGRENYPPERLLKRAMVVNVWGHQMRSGVCGGGPWGAVCVMAKVGEAALERTSGGGEITPLSCY